MNERHIPRGSDQGLGHAPRRPPLFGAVTAEADERRQRDCTTDRRQWQPAAARGRQQQARAQERRHDKKLFDAGRHTEACVSAKDDRFASLFRAEHHEHQKHAGGLEPDSEHVGAYSERQSAVHGRASREQHRPPARRRPCPVEAGKVIGCDQGHEQTQGRQRSPRRQRRGHGVDAGSIERPRQSAARW